MTAERFEGKISSCKWKSDNMHTKGLWGEFGTTTSENPCERRGILPPSTAFEIYPVSHINMVFLELTKGKILWKSQIGVLPNYPEITRCIGVLIKETSFCELGHDQACCPLHTIHEGSFRNLCLPLLKIFKLELKCNSLLHSNLGLQCKLIN